MTYKTIALIPCLAAVLYLVPLPKAQGAYPIPTPTATSSTLNIYNPVTNDTGTDFIFDTETQVPPDAVITIDDVVVMQADGLSSKIYTVCFEYSTYTTVFDSGRTDCNSNNSGTPEFLGQQGLATLAGGGEDPAGMPTSNGTLTALNNFLDNQGVIRTVGNIINSDPYRLAETQFLIPYAVNLANSTLEAVIVSYDIGGTNKWILDGVNTFNTTDNLMFARFKQTGEITLVVAPEPSTLVGIGLAGTLMLAKRRRRS